MSSKKRKSPRKSPSTKEPDVCKVKEEEAKNIVEDIVIERVRNRKGEREKMRECNLSFPNDPDAKMKCFHEGRCKLLDSSFKPFTEAYIKRKEFENLYNEKCCFKIPKSKRDEVDQNLTEIGFLSLDQMSSSIDESNDLTLEEKALAKSEMEGGFEDFWKIVETLGSELAETLYDFLRFVSKKIWNFVQKGANLISNAIKMALQLIQAWFRKPKQEQEIMEREMEKQQTYYEKFLNLIPENVKSLGSSGWEKLKSGVSKLWDISKSGIKKILEYVWSMVKWIVEFVIRSPTFAYLMSSVVLILRDMACESFSLWLGYQKQVDLEEYDLAQSKKRGYKDLVHPLYLAFTKEFLNGIDPMGLGNQFLTTAKDFFEVSMGIISSPINFIAENVGLTTTFIVVIKFIQNIIWTAFRFYLSGWTQYQQVIGSFQKVIHLFLSPCIRDIEVHIEENKESIQPENITEEVSRLLINKMNKN